MKINAVDRQGKGLRWSASWSMMEILRDGDKIAANAAETPTPAMCNVK